ncbi:MAG: HEAT repeat domain-containing protein, partial [Akkermansiaceae bacterium]|nr:HEAT repeat domain-containing protein [Akkermansiaceae bacterium]
MSLSKFKLTLLAALCCGAMLPSSGQTAAKEQETKLIAVLNSTADFNAKSDACRELAPIGTAAAVPALAALLADEKLAHMARYGLEPISDPAVDVALREALGKLKGHLQVGVIGSIGVRRDAQAVGALVGLLKDSDAEVQQAAARALGMLATAEAVTGLEAALAGAPPANQLALCEGLFRCAEARVAEGHAAPAIVIYDKLRALPHAPHQVLAGAWRGAILERRQAGLPLLLEALRSSHPELMTAGLRIALEMEGAEVSMALADELGKVPPARQIQLSSVLGRRGDAAALPALITLAEAGDPTARVAAIKAATELGNAAAVTPLIGLLGDPDAGVAQAAATGLAGLPGAEVDAIVIGTLASPDQAKRLKMLELVRQRRIAAAMPAPLKLMDDQNPAVRAAAVTSYAELA